MKGLCSCVRICLSFITDLMLLFVMMRALDISFIVNMYYAFQDRDNLYLVMDMLSGGDLRYHICKHRRFSEEQTSKL